MNEPITQTKPLTPKVKPNMRHHVDGSFSVSYEEGCKTDGSSIIRIIDRLTKDAALDIWTREMYRYKRVN